VEPSYPSLAPLVAYINGRHQPDLRATMVALPAGAPAACARRLVAGCRSSTAHPSGFRDAGFESRRAFSYGWTNIDGGLDGIALDLPALEVQPTHGRTSRCASR